VGMFGTLIVSSEFKQARRTPVSCLLLTPDHPGLSTVLFVLATHPAPRSLRLSAPSLPSWW
jgi:hypothetical protein